MPFTNKNNNSSQRAGRGLGPCGAGMARGRGVGLRQNSAMGLGNGRGQGPGLRRRDGFCLRMQNQNLYSVQNTSELEQRIANLEAENRRLKAEANK